MTLLQTCLKSLRSGEPSTDSVISWFGRAIADYDQWFDRVTGRGFGIDVYDHAFDPSSCALTAGSNSRLLVFRVEDMGKRQLRESLGDFLRTDIPSIENDDKSGERRFFELYKGFKAIAKFDETARWIDDLVPAFGQSWWWQDELAEMRKAGWTGDWSQDSQIDKHVSETGHVSFGAPTS